MHEYSETQWRKQKRKHERDGTRVLILFVLCAMLFIVGTYAGASDQAKPEQSDTQKENAQ